ncbi:hypothetical protein ACHAQA_010169 [Verticillium albo-atrum]
MRLLDQDARPTFVLDLDPDDEVTDGGAKHILPIFCNTALRLHEKLLDAALGRADPAGQVGASEDTAHRFRSWAAGVTKFDNSGDVFPLSFEFQGIIWTGSTVRKRWRLVSGNLLAALASCRPTAQAATALPVRSGTRLQQNEITNITSHEMRNSTWAILQCADSIRANLDPRQAHVYPASAEAVRTCLEAAQTILLCAQHQMFIVDDILTMSELGSNLLIITPVSAQPVKVLRHAVKMFDAELQAKKVEIVCKVDSSFADLGVVYAMLDPHRILQILVNLIANAITFTADLQRYITVSVGVSQDLPLEANIPDFRFIPTRTQISAVGVGDKWGTGDIIYLTFQVTDTGVGLTSEEIKVLFERFSQASPRTYAKHRGSGLGMFISRHLAELHGGQIGVASKATTGNTFGFFIKARKATPTDLFPGLSNRLERQLPSWATLPVRPLPPRDPDLPSSGPVASMTSNTLPPPGLNPSQIDILVVEDNLINERLLVKQLKKRGGYNVSVANDGVEALSRLNETHFLRPGGANLSVILMDLEMPIMDGLTCVREIRKMEAAGTISTHVPVIAMSVNVRQEHIAAAKTAGVDDFVSKPLGMMTLINQIEELLLLKKPAHT